MCLVQAHEANRCTIAATTLLETTELDVAGEVIRFRTGIRTANAVGSLRAIGDKLDLAEDGGDARNSADGHYAGRRNIERLAHVTENARTSSGERTNTVDPGRLGQAGGEDGGLCCSDVHVQLVGGDLRIGGGNGSHLYTWVGEKNYGAFSKSLKGSRRIQITSTV